MLDYANEVAVGGVSDSFPSAQQLLFVDTLRIIKRRRMHTFFSSFNNNKNNHLEATPVKSKMPKEFLFDTAFVITNRARSDLQNLFLSHDHNIKIIQCLTPRL